MLIDTAIYERTLHPGPSNGRRVIARGSWTYRTRYLPYSIFDGGPSTRRKHNRVGVTPVIHERMCKHDHMKTHPVWCNPLTCTKTQKGTKLPSKDEDRSIQLKSKCREKPTLIKNEGGPHWWTLKQHICLSSVSNRHADGFEHDPQACGWRRP